jgi:hypothetical protein
MKPLAIVDGFAVEAHGAQLILTRTGGDRFVLPPAMAAVWRAADGRTDVAGLLAAARAVEPAADTQMVFAALDALADDGLLHRALPPVASEGRRRAMRTLAAAAASLVVLPGLARAADESPAASSRTKSADVNEQKTKEVVKGRLAPLQAEEERAKGDLLAAETRANEERAKLDASPAAELAARRRSEEEAKAHVSAVRKKADAAKEQVVKAQATPDKAQAR